MSHDQPDPADHTRFEDALSRGLAGSTPTSDDCPDPESLAAFSEDSLPAADRLALESHLADCVRCQAHLAALVRTESVDGDVDRPTVTSAPGWLDWRWLAPLATAAVVLLAVWTVDPTSVDDSNREMVEPAPTSSSADVARQERGRPDDDRQISEQLQEDRQAVPADAGVTRTLEEVVERDRTDLRVPENETRQAEAFSPEERQPVERPTPSAGADRRRAEPALSARAAAPLGNRASELEDGLLAVSPSQASSWRVTPDGGVEHSTDGGVTWTRQLDNTGSEITAASAPSDSVCWLIGRNGTILRTENGGTSWDRIEAPLDADAVSVTATDGQTAVISFSDGQTFATENGGATWRQQ